MNHKTISVSFEKNAMMSISHQSLESIRPISTSVSYHHKKYKEFLFFSPHHFEMTAKLNKQTLNK